MAQTLAMACNEHLPHVEYAYNNAVSAAIDLAPYEVHIGRVPRTLLTVFGRSFGGVHQLTGINLPIATALASTNNTPTNSWNSTLSPSLM